MGTPGSPAFLLPPGDDEIPRRLRDIERSIMELGPSIAASIKPAMDDIRANVAAIAAQQVVLTAQQADLAAQDIVLTTQQATLTDLISKVVVSASNKSFNAGAAVTTTRTNMATAIVAVPAGFTKAQVWAFSDAMALNSTASAGYLYVATAINTYDGGENYVGCQSGYANSVSHSATTALTGLTGGDPINCNVSSKTTAAWAANTANLWRIQAVVIFSR